MWLTDSGCAELTGSGCEQVVVTDLAVDYTGLDDEEVRHLSITLKPRVECYKRSMSLEYEPSSEPLHISAK